LSFSEWKEIILKIKDWYGPFQFSLGGGEPLLHKDLLDIIRFAVEEGCKPSVITNGTLLSKQLISELVEAGLSEIVLSLNGMTEGTHDFTRGITGSYRKIMSAIDNLNQYGNRITVGIATILMGYNIAETPDMVRWVKTNGLDRITFQALFYDTGVSTYREGWYNASELWAVRNGTYAEHIDKLIDMKTNGYPIGNPVEQLEHFKTYFSEPDKEIPIPCKIGVHGFFIECDGSVKLCYLFDPIGNLVDHTPKPIWNSSQARKTRKAIKKCPLNCRLKNCNYYSAQ
jgi:MoaA/NifB/PqqE/SkfB family radical SAM enzyme